MRESCASPNKRKCGVLLPVFSLPSDYGIGTLGQEAYRFIDFLSSAGQDCWQMLPMGPTGYGDSPYQPFSSFAGNPYFIDLDMLSEEGLLLKDELKASGLGGCQGPVDYGRQYSLRYGVLKRAWARYDSQKDDSFHEFVDLNRHWLSDYALFMALKDSHSGAAWTEWEADIIKREHTALKAAGAELSDGVNFYMFLQHMFFRQFFRLRDYAEAKGVKLIGDLPIYVAPDSADVWSNPQVFMLDDDLKLELVAGVPPDAFSDEGQLWGNPVYDWDYLRSTSYRWWIDRIRHAKNMYSCIRIDHFRGLDEFWAVPQGSKNAVNGKWYESGGKDFIDAVKTQCDNIPIIAEDLGIITDRVRMLREYAGYLGMKVLQFAFDGNTDNPYLPDNYNHDCVAYTGTHDNDTLVGWLANSSSQCRTYIAESLNIENNDNLAKNMIEVLYNSPADLCILPFQDLLGVGGEGRINTPSVAWGNWVWRLDKDYSSRRLCEDIKSAVMRGSQKRRVKMKILVTGFEAFGGESINPALEIIKKLPSQISGADIITLELPTAFDASKETLEKYFAEVRPDAVVSIGQAGGRGKMTVEKIGINLQDAPIEDNRGSKPTGRKVYEDGADGYFTNLPVKRIVADMNASGVPAEVSYSAGTFVCNSVLYTIMYNINKRYPNMKGGFVHVPFLPVQATDKRGVPSMSLNDMIKAITTMIEVIAENRPEIDKNEGITN